MRSDQAKTIAISEYLAQVEGIQPVHARMGGKELWYRSPIRQNDKTPSFKVDTELNLWFDHGLSEGGKIIDLVCKVRETSVREALAILERSGLYQGGTNYSRIPTRQNTALFTSASDATHNGKNSAGEKEKDSASQSNVLTKTKPLQHPALLQYLQSRCVDETIARTYLDEVHFKPHDKLVQYYAVGWKSGTGYEVRNKYYKGFVGTGKTISTLQLDTHDEWLVFEGFMDFLSYLTYLKQHKHITQLNKGVVVLNSTALRKQLLAEVAEKQPKTLYLFLDNDTAGNDTHDFYQQALQGQNLQDMRYLYSGYKDFNEWWCHTKTGK